ncbi:MAG: hypothetical protein IH602_06190 [Bryobacteraceae bacterium]|nr:hypothetical protein [Bryobacteraceae bacterium]
MRVALKDRSQRARHNWLRLNFYFLPGKLIHRAHIVMVRVRRKAVEVA